MIDSLEIQLAIRARFLSLVVATSTAPALAAIANGYTRTDGGSFLADRFAKGMEVTPAGFGVNARRVIANVTADQITIAGAPLALEAAAPGRTLTVGVPKAATWEDVDLEPIAGVPWAEEQFAGGPRAQTGVAPAGEGGDMDLRPMAILYIHAPANSGIAARRYADAILQHFRPGLELATSSGAPFFVGSDPAPYDQQYQRSRPGFGVVPVVLPLWVPTFND